MKFLSVSNIVIAPAKTGNESNSKNAVINTDHTNKGRVCIFIPGLLILKIVVIKLIAPKIEEAPAKCKLKIAKSTAGPECDPWFPDKGGYTVHPVPAPDSTNDEKSNKSKAGGKSQKLMLFSRGNAISGAPIINGINQLPKPPIIIGITIKKIIMKACAVTITLYNCELPNKIWLPGCASSIRIKTDRAVPITPAKAPKIRYKVPISLWFVEKSHRDDQL